MSDGVVQRTQYRNVNTGTVRNGATGHGESLTDVEGYLLPMAAAGTGATTGPGVAQGFAVTVTTGAVGVRVGPGVGFDAAGRTLALTSGGVAVVERELDPGQVLDVPTVSVPQTGALLDTVGLSGVFVVTATWQEAQQESALANAPVLLHAPWLRLVPSSDFADTGQSLALARVSIAADGTVTGLDAGPRRRIAVRAGRLDLDDVTVGPAGAGAAVGHTPLATFGGSAEDGISLELLGGAAAPLTAIQVVVDSGEVRLPEGVTTSVLRTVSPGGRSFELRTTDDKWFVHDPKAVENRLSIDPDGNVAIGINELDAKRRLHVEGSEVHSGGGGGGFSFADRAAAGGAFVNLPAAGERWVWYGLGGAAHLWSGFDRLSVSAVGEGGGLDVGRRMRVRQGGDASAGIWFHQRNPNADRAFVGMSDDTHIGFWGNTGIGWGLQMDTTTGELSFSSQFGRRSGPSTLNLWGSTVSDLGGGVLSIRSGGNVVAFDGGDSVGINTRTPGAALEVVGGVNGIIGRGGGGSLQAGVIGSGNLGLWGQGSNNGILASGPNFAGVFWGHVQVTRDLHVLGTIFKGGGGFRIDHPLAPSEKYLSHSFVESPDMATLYAGTAVTDGDGRARVVLPDYFDALNRDARVQLTTVGSLSAVTLDGAVHDGSFTIRTAEPEVTVSWMVTGVRQDAWAEANRIRVEEEKPPAEQDRYLHAEALDRPLSANLAGPEAPEFAEYATLLAPAPDATPDRAGTDRAGTDHLDTDHLDTDHTPEG